MSLQFVENLSCNRLYIPFLEFIQIYTVKGRIESAGNDGRRYRYKLFSEINAKKFNKQNL
jgi:hypothetical protein